MRRRQWLLGIGATLIVLALQGVGALDKLVVELWSLDERATRFGRSSLAPSPELAVIAIDDSAITTVGRWPWDRQRLAQAIDELSRAGASVIALDILMDEPQRPRWVDDRHASADHQTPLKPVHDDALLAAAMRRHGRVVLATNFAFDRVRENGQLATGRLATSISTAAVLSAIEREPMLLHWPEEQAAAGLAAMLLAEEDLAADRGFAREDLREKLRAARMLIGRNDESSLPLPSGAGALENTGRAWPRSSSPPLPAAMIGAAAARLANVTVSDTSDPDGKIRRVPLLVEHRGRLWPMLGVSAVALHRGIELRDVDVRRGELAMGAAAGGAGRAPMMRQRIGGRAIDGLHFVTWPRATPSWMHQFRPADTGLGEDVRSTAITLSMLGVLNPILVAERVAANVRTLDRWTRAALSAQLLSIDDYEAASDALASAEAAGTGEDWEDQVRSMRSAWSTAAADAASFLEMLGDDAPETEEDRQLIAMLKEISGGFPRLLAEVDAGLERMTTQRARLRELLDGRICFVGFASTAAAVDVVGTSVHPRTPGVYIHAAVANAILTGMARQPAPAWVNFAAIAVLGALGTLVGVRGSVLTGPLAIVLVIVLWFLVCGVIFWDSMWLVVGVTGPSIAAAGGWLGVMLHRLLVEQRARRRTEERFRSYVSPAVVDILVNNPELDSMAPQKRELTVMFTDLAGFTTTAERLGSIRTAEVLSTYLGSMTEILQSSGATLDKYLGDGIMAFWGAPIRDAEHAAHACRAALEMIRALDLMNAQEAFGEGQILTMRAGIATGELMVGDFGNPPRNSSYTVIGDAANVAARLETANKHFGTQVLISQRVREMIGDRFLVRPIGRIAVRGKKEAEGLFELIGERRPQGARTAEWIDLTAKAVEAYQRGDFEVAEAALDQLERDFGEARLARVYRQSIAEWGNLVRAGANGKSEGAGSEFDGTIVLTEK